MRRGRERKNRVTMNRLTRDRSKVKGKKLPQIPFHTWSREKMRVQMTCREKRTSWKSKVTRTQESLQNHTSMMERKERHILHMEHTRNKVMTMTWHRVMKKSLVMQRMAKCMVNT